MKKKFIEMGTIRKVWIVCSMMFASLFGLSSCGDDYDDSELRGDIGNLEDRITALEEWQKSVNSDIRSLQSLVAALENKDYVTAVTPLENGTGYVISFLKGGNITIKHGERGEQGEKGEDGTMPVISVKLDTDGKYYWTVNGEWLLNSGNKIPVTGEKGDKGDKGDNGTAGSDGLTPYIGDNGNWWIGTMDTGVKAQGNIGTDGQTPHIGDNGNWWIGTTDTGVKAQGDKGADAIAPQVRINADTNEWEISADGGKTWNSTGVKATGDKGNTGAQGEKGDSMFSNIDNSNEAYVELTLADGVTKIKLPRYSSAVRFESYEPADVYMVGETELKVILPDNLLSNNYGCLIATVTPTSGAYTRAADNGWSVNITSPDFTETPATATVSVKGDGSLATGDQALLCVMLTYTDGTQVSASRLVQISLLGTKTATDDNIVKGDYYMCDGSFVGRYTPLTDAQKAACVGRVFALANEDDESDYSTTGIGQKKCHGYVVALTDAYETDCVWSTVNVDIEGIENVEYNGKSWNGYKDTQAILNEANYSETTYPAAYYAVNYAVKAPATSSGWFLPAVEQMNQAGIAARNWSDMQYYYWSSSEYTDNQFNSQYVNAVCPPGGYAFYKCPKSDKYSVRSVLAF